MKFICAVLLAASVLACGDTSYSQYQSRSSATMKRDTILCQGYRPDMKRETIPRQGYRPELCEYVQKFVNSVANVYNTYDIGYERATRANAYHNTFNNAVAEFSRTTSNDQEHKWVIEIWGYAMNWSSSLMKISSYQRDNITDYRMRMARENEAELWEDVCRMCKGPTLPGAMPSSKTPAGCNKPDIRMLHEKAKKTDSPIPAEIPRRK